MQTHALQSKNNSSTRNINPHARKPDMQFCEIIHEYPGILPTCRENTRDNLSDNSRIRDYDEQL